MDQLFDLTTWREILVRAFSEMGANVATFLPNFVGAALILLVGWGVSRGIEAVASRTFRTVGMDRVAERLRIADTLRNADIGLTFSEIVAKLLFWLVMLTFVLSGVETLGLSAVTATIDRLIAFIPNVIGAAFIAFGGLLLGRFASSLVSSGAAAVGIERARQLGFVAELMVIALFIVLAAEQIGIATSILVLPVSVAIAAGGFAVGLAFALGAQPVITHIMAGHFLKQSLPRDVSVEVDGMRGLVERVGAVDTLIRSDDRVWSVPNGRLLDRVVVR